MANENWKEMKLTLVGDTPLIVHRWTINHPPFDIMFRAISQLDDEYMTYLHPKTKKPLWKKKHGGRWEKLF